jgi:hypothetical protein
LISGQAQAALESAGPSKTRGQIPNLSGNVSTDFMNGLALK